MNRDGHKGLYHIPTIRKTNEITKSEYCRLYKMITKTMDSITPVPEEIEEKDAEKKPEGC